MYLTNLVTARDLHDMAREAHGMARYRVLTEWQIDAPVERVWDALLLTREWPSWWRGFRSVDQVATGDAQGVGMRLRQRWRSLLPLTLTLDLEIVGVERHRRLTACASGDLRGTCRWTFEPRAGGTVVRFLLDVTPGRPWMRLPLPFAGRMFALNHGAIMRWGSEGLAALLQATVVDRSGETRPAAA